MSDVTVPVAPTPTAVQALAWHPNFRNFEKLPDTKTIRTSFFINGAAIFITVGLLLYTVYGEYLLHEMAGETAGYEANIAKEQKKSDDLFDAIKQALEKKNGPTIPPPAAPPGRRSRCPNNW